MEMAVFCFWAVGRTFAGWVAIDRTPPDPEGPVWGPPTPQAQRPQHDVQICDLGHHHRQLCEPLG